MTASQDPAHPSAVGSTNQVSVNPDTQQGAAAHEGGIDAEPSTDEAYPPQRHAGAVGYGPNYHQGPTFTDKLGGMKEEVKGKVFRKPEVAQHGKDRRTGELKRKEQEEDLNSDPFGTAEDKQEETKEREQAAKV
ncbi:hypothetical protein PQX77_007830 [Marasmius sp. AFHP31]|nr:hypothetical protein PQX77_007830 [Marasmius sp. AFHP31]